MKKNYKKFFISLSIIVSVILITALIAVFFLLFTKIGSSYIIREVLASFSSRKEISWQKNEGTFAGGMVYENVVIADVKWLPLPNKLQIQKVFIEIDSLSPSGASLKIENARLMLPASEPILCFGEIEKGKLNFNIYAKSITAHGVKNLIKSEGLKGISGELIDVDAYVKGFLSEPRFEGSFTIKQIQKDGFSLSNANCKLDLTLREKDNVRGLYGNILFQDGAISGDNTAIIRLKESRIIFSGDPSKPAFDMNGTSRVGKIRMNIALKGDFNQPDLRIKSDSSASQDRLLLALATNKTWEGAEELFDKGVISPDLAKDFIDYFVFGGQGSRLAEEFGLKDISIKYDEKSKGIGAAAEYKVTDEISVSTEKEFKPNGKAEEAQNKQPADDKVMLKFKKDF